MSTEALINASSSKNDTTSNPGDVMRVFSNNQRINQASLASMFTKSMNIIANYENDLKKIAGFLLNAETTETEKLDSINTRITESISKQERDVLAILEQWKGKISDVPPSSSSGSSSQSSQIPPHAIKSEGNDNKTYKLDSNTPIFKGKKDVRNWVFVMNEALTNAKVKEEDKLGLITPYLRGLPLEYLINFKRDYFNPDWKAFSVFLIEQFEPFNQKQLARNELMKIKHFGNFDTFKRKFLSLLNKVDNIDNDQQIDLFENALKDDTKYEVIKSLPSSLADAIKIATIYEQSKSDYSKNKEVFQIKKSKKEKEKEVNQINRGGNKKNFQNFKKKPHYNNNNNNNNNSNNNSRNNEKNKENDRKPRKEIQCYSCKQMGHYKSECRSVNSIEPVKKEENNTALKRYSDINVLNVISAEKCSDKVLSIKGDVNGKKIRALLDTGAVVSTISLKLVKKLDLKVVPTEIKIKTAENNISKALGVVNKVTITIEKHACDMNELIVIDNDHDLILGINWFEATSASLIFKNGRRFLKFDSDLIDLNLIESLDYDDIEEDFYDIFNSEIAQEEIDFDHDYWNFESDKKTKYIEKLIKPDSILEPEQHSVFEEKIAKPGRELIAKSVEDLSECSIGRHKIVTDSPPIHVKPYRYSEKDREIIRKEVNTMLEAGIIRPSRSPWSFPVVLVPKPNGTRRLCIDYRKLNAVTQKESWPMPNIEELLEKVGKGKWFTRIDLKMGFWQFLMDLASVPLTSFSTPDGHFELLRMGFGLKNAPFEFQRLMYELFKDCKFVAPYLDDIIIFSEDFDQHVNDVKTVIDILAKAKLKLNHEKSIWFAKQIELLGHFITNNSISMDPEKVRAINDRVPPKNVKQLQQFLGLCNYYRRFVRDFARIAAPLFRLLCKDVKFEWTLECQLSFEQLKSCLMSYPVLRPPDFNRQFLLYSDASGFALGCILAQIDDDGNEYIVSYKSRLLKGAEVNYSISEKECLGIIWGLKGFRIYLHGQPFKIITDHSALTWLKNIADPVGRLARWAVYLQSFEYEIIHRKGKLHANVDALSRPVLVIDEIPAEEITEPQFKNLDPWEDEALLHYLKFGRHIVGASNRQVKRVLKLAYQYKFEKDDLKYARNPKTREYLIYPKPIDREEIIKKAHNFGHFQFQSTYNRIKVKYFWKNMIKEIWRVIRCCTTCQRHQKIKPLSHPALALEVDSIYDRIGLDLVLGLPQTAEGYIGILVITEYLSKYPYAVPIRSKTAEEIARHLLTFISMFGPPKIILTDQGREFCNSVVENLISNIGVEHKVTSAYNPRTDGQTERFNQTLIEALRKHSETNPTNWHLWLPFVLMAYRSRVHSVTKMSPYELMFGRPMNQFENWTNEPTKNDAAMLLQRTLEIRKMIDETHNHFMERINEIKEDQKLIQDRRSRLRIAPLESGTRVFIKCEGILNKMDARFSGPFIVVRKTANHNYVLTDVLGNELKMSYPLHKLKIVGSDSHGNEEVDEVIEVLDHRTEDDTNWYLVKWRNDNENSWIPEENFNTMEVIKKYFDKIEKTKKQTKPRKIVLKRKKLNPLGLNFLTILCFILFLFTPALGLTVEGEFDYCNTNSADMDLIDYNGPCKSYDRFSNEKPGSTHAFVLSKMHEVVNGEGFQCIMKKLTRRSEETLFFSKHTDSWIENVKLSREDCEYMVKTKRCDQYPMKCNGNHCKFHQDPPANYRWGSTVTTFNYSCSIVPRYITAKSTSDLLFGQACKPTDGFCMFDDEVIIWDPLNIIHDCPFSLIGNVTLVENVAQTNHYKLYMSKNNHWLFNMTLDNYFTCTCKGKRKLLFRTSEGPYLNIKGDARESFDCIKSEIMDETTITNLMLAESDWAREKAYQERTELNYEICKSFNMQLHTFALFHDRSFRIRDLKDNEAIVYSMDGQIYVPQCKKIQTIEVDEDRTTCFRDLPITFTNSKNKKYTGYLTTERVIRLTSEIVKCDGRIRHISLGKDDKAIRIQNGKVDLVGDRNFYKNKIRLQAYNLDDINFKHSEIITEGFDVIHEIERLTSVNTVNGDYVVLPNHDVVNEQSAAAAAESAKTASQILRKRVVFGLLIILIICLSFSCLCCLLRSRNLELDRLRCMSIRDNIRIENLRRQKMCNWCPGCMKKNQRIDRIRLTDLTDNVIPLVPSAPTSNEAVPIIKTRSEATTSTTCVSHIDSPPVTATSTPLRNPKLKALSFHDQVDLKKMSTSELLSELEKVNSLKYSEDTI